MLLPQPHWSKEYPPQPEYTAWLADAVVNGSQNRICAARFVSHEMPVVSQHTVRSARRNACADGCPAPIAS